MALTPTHRTTGKTSRPAARPKVGRPRLGTEDERLHALLDDALTVFLRDGYAAASIAKIATAAGVSTRTIYERYQNKADLMVAAVTRMVEQDLQTRIDMQQLQRMAPAQGLLTFGLFILERVTSPTIVALYRIGVAEASRFPELAAKMQATAPRRIEGVIIDYLNHHLAQAVDPGEIPACARLFIQMVIAEPRHRALMGMLPVPGWHAEQHVQQVVKVFLHGVLAHAR